MLRRTYEMVGGVWTEVAQARNEIAALAGGPPASPVLSEAAVLGAITRATDPAACTRIAAAAAAQAARLLTPPAPAAL